MGCSIYNPTKILLEPKEIAGVLVTPQAQGRINQKYKAGGVASDRIVANARLVTDWFRFLEDLIPDMVNRSQTRRLLIAMRKNRYLVRLGQRFNKEAQ